MTIVVAIRITGQIDGIHVISINTCINQCYIRSCFTDILQMLYSLALCIMNSLNQKIISTQFHPLISDWRCICQ